MPREIRQPPFGPGDLDDDTIPVEAIVGVPEIGATQRGKSHEAGVRTERRDARRPLFM